MFCPKCRDEFVPRIRECPDCHVALVDTLQEEILPQDEYEYVELVTVFECDMSTALVAKSLLEGAGIKYFAKGERLQHLFGFGYIGTGYNMIVGAVQLQVAKADEETAKAILADLEQV
ncbi:MAG: DUF2007 domain-containing protein [Bacillota bacterium]|nr:DUF2007 domain-containing protein [Bacillota bacterium]MDW7684550.1 DUF2007 domain-containing protein [Bacillota bacterium]